MNLSDCHMHSLFSGDSNALMEDMVTRSIELNLNYICFTDHMDLEYPKQYNLLFEFDITKYFDQISTLQEKYKGKINILKGIELGLQPSITDKINSIVANNDFDFVIGSSHLVDNLDPYYNEFWTDKTPFEGCFRYFQNILDNLNAFDNFDSYGHLDYIIRYSKEALVNYSYSTYSDILDEILITLINHNKALEINSAGLKYGLPFAHPKEDILKRYYELGGRLITLGADAHKLEHIAYSFDKVKDVLLSIGFKEYAVFVNRIPIFFPL